MRTMKFIYSILVVLMVVATGIQKANAQKLHGIITAPYRPVDDAQYAAATKGEIKGYFYGGKAGLTRKIEMSHYLFNFSDNKRNFKTLPAMNGKHPVTEIQYIDKNGKFVEKDTITIEGTIMLLTDYNLAYGYDAGFNVDSIDTDFCYDNGEYGWYRRAVKPNELRRMIAGVTLYSKGPTGCGNDIDLPAVKLGNNERTGDQNNQNAVTDNGGLKATADNRQSNSTATLTIDTLGHTMIFNFQNIGNATATGGTVNNSGNSEAAPAAAQGSFQKVEYQDVVNHGYDAPYVYNAQYYQWQQPNGQQQYVSQQNGQWMTWQNGAWFLAGAGVGWILNDLFTQCNSNQATGCGYGYGSNGDVVVNNYNYNNNTVNTGGNPPPPNPNGGPQPVPNGDGNPVVNNNGNPQPVENGPGNVGNRNQAYVYRPQANTGGNPPPRTQQANQGQSRPNGQVAQQAPQQTRGNTNVNPAPRPNQQVAQQAPQQTRGNTNVNPAPRAAPAPSGFAVRNNNVPRAR